MTQDATLLDITLRLISIRKHKEIEQCKYKQLAMSYYDNKFSKKDSSLIKVLQCIFACLTRCR